MARGRKERELRQSRITVIGEGLTERWYFDHLRTVMGYRYDCKPRFFSHQSYEEMRKLIEWVLQSGGIAVCVCDADITRTNMVESQRLKEMKDHTIWPAAVMEPPQKPTHLNWRPMRQMVC